MHGAEISQRHRTVHPDEQSTKVPRSAKTKTQKTAKQQHTARATEQEERRDLETSTRGIADQSAQEDGPNKAQVQSMHARTDGRTDGRTDDAVRGDVVGLAVEDVRDAGVEVAGVAPNLKT